MLEKSQNFTDLLLLKLNLLKNRNLSFSHSALFHMKTRVCLKYL